MKRINDCVNVFQGCEKIDLPKPEGVAATWLFIKALIGNTSPYASYPFGRISCGPYTGGYSSGYGNHKPNSCGDINTFDAKVHGFAHLQHAGAGGIKCYYNYALVSPLYHGLGLCQEELGEEIAHPGYYSTTLKNSGIKAEVAVTEKKAYHRYYFNGKGILQVDFSNCDLDPSFGPRFSFHASEANMSIQNKTLLSRVVMHGIPLYMAARCDEAKDVYLWESYERIDADTYECPDMEKTFGGAFSVEGTTELQVTISLNSFEEALLFLDENTLSVEEASKSTANVWEKYLSAIEIETEDERLKEIFYSNLYHSFLKPANWGEKYVDFPTMWDIYKTQLPLVFTLFAKEGKGITDTMLNLMEEYGYSPINVNLHENNDSQDQCRMIMEHSLADYFFRGGDLDVDRVLKNAVKDLQYNEKAQSTETADSYTHVLDVACACEAMYQLALATNHTEMAEFFAPYIKNWEATFDKETGLLGASHYYEGIDWNYSFRLVPDMEKRIELAGGKERMITLLDEFFGFTRQPVEQFGDLSHASWEEYNGVIEKHHSFQGFNNEPDMETPFNYVAVGRHDRLCEIMRACIKYIFSDGRGGIPGNNDGGGLSSCYIWNVIGLFPVAGQNLMYLGCPAVDKSKVHLANGNTLEIIAHNLSEENMYVKKVLFNGEEMIDFRITVTEMMQGGRIEFLMCSKPM